MSETNCVQCGAPLAETSVGRICPRCLLNDGFEPAAGGSVVAATLPRWFGEYELLDEIGRGGMGVVYRARQANLNRLVALKIPSVSAVAYPELYQRFRGEAAAAARLRHPFIVTIHDSGEVDGQAYYVMDLIAGRNLEQLCGGMPLEVRRAAALLRQLAQAVHHAHVAGVVHRDLKPSNVLVDDAGEPHITDFGLARLVERCDGATLVGQMLGSPGYAAPEQIEGRNDAVGVATDVYSLGALGYHLATGRAPFVGRSSGETLRLMHEGRPPRPRVLNPAVPRDFEAILLKCLERDPARRYLSAAELATDLERFGGARPVEAVVRRARPGNRRWLSWVFAAGLAAVAVVGTVIWEWRFAAGAGRSSGEPVVHATIELPAEAPMAPASNTPLAVPALPLAISPDGLNLVYVAQIGETRRLCLRPMNGTEVRPLPGTDGAYGPVFSPDGRSVAFLTDSRVKRTSVGGGDIVSLCEVTDDTYGLVWGNDGYLYLSDSGTLKRVPETGGQSERVAALMRASGITPMGRGDGLLFRRSSDSQGGSCDYRAIQAFGFRSGQITNLNVTGHSARLLAGNCLVFARGDGLFGVQLASGMETCLGSPVKLMSGLQTDAYNGRAYYTLSESGTLVYAEGGDVGTTIPAWVDRQGKVSRLPVAPMNCGTFDLSPDGRWLALVVHDAQSEVLLIDVETGASRRFGDAGYVGDPLWAPDGQTLLYLGTSDGRLAIRAGSPLDQGRTSKVLYEAPPDVLRMRLQASSSVRNSVLFTTVGAGSTSGIFLLDPAGTAAPERMAPLGGGFLQFSPDGQWLALTGHRTGRSEVYVRRFSGGPEAQVTFQGGEESRWSVRGDELFYRYGSVWYAVPVVLEPEVKVGTPREIFRGPYANISGFEYSYDPNTDRFLVLLPARVQEPQTRLRVVVNWGAELRRRLEEAARKP